MINHARLQAIYAQALRDLRAAELAQRERAGQPQEPQHPEHHENHDDDQHHGADRLPDREGGEERADGPDEDAQDEHRDEQGHE